VGARGQRDPYTDVHLSLIKQITDLQAAGETLDAIRVILATTPVSRPLTTTWQIPEHVQYREFVLDRDVRVQVQADATVSRMRRIVRALGKFSRALNEQADE